MRFTNAKRLAA